MDHSPTGSPVHGIPKARILEGLPLPPPGDLPDPETKMVSPVLPWLVDSLPLVPPGKSVNIYSIYYFYEVKWSRFVMSDSLPPHELQPTRLLCPWDSPGKNNGVVCHILLQGIFPTQGLKLLLPHCRWTFTVWATAAAKALQSCPTLCDPIDGSPPGSPVPGTLQARTLEWVAISFSNAWKWKVKVKSLSRVRLLATPWTAAYQASPSMGFSRQEYWSGVPSPSPVWDTREFLLLVCLYSSRFHKPNIFITWISITCSVK